MLSGAFGPPRATPSGNQNTFVSGDDFDAFVAAFEAGHPSADFDLNGFLNGNDFDLFVVAFEAGC